MPIKGKFVGKGVYVEELEETHSLEEIESLDFSQFKQFCGFLNQKELGRLSRLLEQDDFSNRVSYIDNIFISLKY